MKPLSISEKTSVRIDSMGVMALQFMIRNPDTDAISFVEIYVSDIVNAKILSNQTHIRDSEQWTDICVSCLQCVPEQEPQDDDDMPAA